MTQTTDTATTIATTAADSPLPREGRGDGGVRSFPRYPAYRDTGVPWLGAIPAHWEPARLKNLLSDRITDGPHTTPIFMPEGIPFLSVDSIQEGELVFDNCRFISEADHASYKTKALPKRGDILLAKAASTGKVAQVRVDFEFSIWSPLALIRLDGRSACSDFVEFSLKSPPLQAQIDVLCTANTQKNLSMDEIPRLVLPLPPLAEQRAITAFLDRETARIDALVAAKRRLIELLREKRAALISRAVTRGLDASVPLRESGVPWLGAIPAHWEVKRLKHLISQPLQYGASEAAEFDDPDWPRFVRITDIAEDGSLRPETFRSLPPDIAALYLLQEGDMLLARSGATVGKSIMCEASWGTACYAGYLIRARLNSAKMIPMYLAFFLSSASYWSWISSVTIQATIQNVSADKYANLQLAVPPISEQRAIAAYLDTEAAKLDALAGRIEQQIARLREYRTALIAAAVTGVIDVRGQVMSEADGAREIAE